MFTIGDEIASRLLDHRCFTTNELKYFVKCFEETRGNCEFNQIDQIDENLKEIGTNGLPGIVEKLNTSNLGTIDTKIDQLLEMSKDLIELEVKEEKRRNRKLAEQIIKYEAEKSLIIKETQVKIADLDTINQDKANNLKKYYRDLEAKWRIDKSESPK
ncbi:biogenesis of lysosome-related organelles complex 1 subunit 5-like [Panonychus citri]|uniref:biogenesis of lysosome-related organelles complex 1 subunit 5-like n=1 Tax=Panonychus citri TaxID=50023 RepID=UPI002307325C|nr:biogenesis of lysosome-related organelles complex 1 subunit 5-like [Panonychus citri]